MAKKIIAFISIVSIILSLVAVPAMAESTDIVFEAESYIDSGAVTFTRTSSPELHYVITESTWTPSVSGGTFRMNPGNWAAYNVTIPESGAYTISAKVRADSDANKVGMSVYDTKNGLSAICDNFFVKTENQSYVYQEIGTAYLKSGVNYLRFMNNIKGVSTALYVDSYTISRDSASDGNVKNKTFVEAEYYNRYEQGSAARRVRMEGGNTNFKVVLDKTQSVEYDVEIKEEGFYNLGAEIGCTGITIKATVNDEDVISKEVPTTGGLATIKPMEFGIVKLSKGINKIKISDSSNTIYFDRLTLEKVETSFDIDLENYTEDSEVSFAGNGSIMLDSEGYASYDILVEFDGAYSVCADSECEIFVDGLNASENAIALEAGQHTVKVVSKDGTTLNSLSYSLVDFSQKFEAKNYEASYDASNPSGSVPIQGKNVSFNPGDWVSYTVNVKESGNYYLRTYGSASAGSKLKVYLGTEDENLLVRGTVNNDGSYNVSSYSNIGAFNLQKGENVLRIETETLSNGGNGYIFNHFTITRIGDVLEEETEEGIVIQAENYAKSGAVNFKRYSSPRAYFEITDKAWAPAITDGTFKTEIGNWTSYNVEVPESGVYTVKAKVMVEDADNTGKVGMTVYDSETGLAAICQSAFAKTEAGEYEYREIGKVNLDAGTNYLRFMNNLNGNSSPIYVDSYTLVKANETIPYNVSVEAEFYNRYDDGTNGKLVRMEGGITTFKLVLAQTQSVEYDVEVKEAGYYMLGALIGCTGITITAEANDNERYDVEIPTTGGISTIVKNDLGMVKLNKGTNKIKFSNPTNAIYFDRFTLEKLDTAFNVDLAEFTEETDGAVFENDGLMLDADGYASYVINASYSGAYEISSDADVKVYIDGVEAIDKKAVISAGEHTLKIASAEGATIKTLSGELFALSSMFDAKEYESCYDASNPGGNVPLQKPAISFNPGDWVSYTINVPSDGKYMFTTFGAAQKGSRIKVLAGLEGEIVLTDGRVNVDGSYTDPSETILGTANLTKGEQVIRLYTETSANGGNGYLLQYFTITRIGDAEFDQVFAVSEMVNSYDDSKEGEALKVVKDTQGIQHVSFGKNDFMDFNVTVAKEGVYKVNVYSGSEEKYGIAKLNVVNSNGSDCYGELPYTGSVYSYEDAQVGDIALEKGFNTIRIYNIGAAFHMVSFSLEYANALPAMAFELGAEDYTFGGEGMGYHDNTEGVDDGDYEDLGDDVERVVLDEGYAIDIEAEEWLNYNITADAAGFYSVKAWAKSDEAVKDFAMYVNEGNMIECSDIFKATDDYALYNLGVVYLNEGENTFMFESLSGSNFCVDKFIFAKEDVTLSEDNGKVTASGNLNGLFYGKDVLCTLAVYDNNGRLIDVDVDTFKGGANDALDLSVNKGAKVKLFVWNNMNGFVKELSK